MMIEFSGIGVTVVKVMFARAGNSVSRVTANDTLCNLGTKQIQDWKLNHFENKITSNFNWNRIRYNVSSFVGSNNRKRNIL